MECQNLQPDNYHSLDTLMDCLESKTQKALGNVRFHFWFHLKSILTFFFNISIIETVWMQNLIIICSFFAKIIIWIYSNNCLDSAQNFKITIIWEKFQKHKHSFTKIKSNFFTSPKRIQESILKKIATFSIRSSCPISIFARRRVPIRQTKQTKYSCRRCGL